jgi:hypothetical protein
MIVAVCFRVMVNAPLLPLPVEGVTEDKYANLHGSTYAVELRLKSAPPAEAVPLDFLFWHAEEVFLSSAELRFTT